MSNKMVINTYLSTVTLKGLNAPIKRHRVPEQIRKQVHTHTQRLTPDGNTLKTESKGMKTVFYENGNEKKMLG